MHNPDDSDSAITPQSTQDAARYRMIDNTGPFPSPQAIQEYETIVPGAGQRIFYLIESQVSHRQTMELKETNFKRLGQIFGFTIGMTAIICGTIAAVNGAELPAAIIGGGGIATLVSLFVYRQRQTPQREG